MKTMKSAIKQARKKDTFVSLIIKSNGVILGTSKNGIMIDYFKEQPINFSNNIKTVFIDENFYTLNDKISDILFSRVEITTEFGTVRPLYITYSTGEKITVNMYKNSKGKFIDVNHVFNIIEGETKKHSFIGLIGDNYQEYRVK